jgi:hypothetical protein
MTTGSEFRALDEVELLEFVGMDPVERVFRDGATSTE